MRTKVTAVIALVLHFSLDAPSARGQPALSLDSLLASHRSAMGALKVLDGVWRGQGWTLLPSGDKATFTQTIRVGSMGEGALRVIEGRSYASDDRLSATNFEVISFNSTTNKYTLRLYTQGNVGDVPIVPSASGFTLEYPEGDATIRFTISVSNGTWHEIAERRASARDPVRFLELKLQRVRDTDWPAAGAVPPT